MKPLAAAAAAVVALALAGVAPGATAPRYDKWIVGAYGFSIILPASWAPVPRTVAAVRQTIANLKKAGKTAEANAYAYYLTPAGRLELKAYVFQAFDTTPTTDPLVPQVAVQVTRGKRPYRQSDLKAAAYEYAATIANGTKGSKVAVPLPIKLPIGAAETFEATIPAGQVTRGIEMYLTIHAGKLYVFSFQIDARYLAEAKLFRSIAENVRWT